MGMPDVTSISEYRAAHPRARDAHLKRLALQLAAQLPDDPDEALEALEHTKTLVRSFLAETRPS